MRASRSTAAAAALYAVLFIAGAGGFWALRGHGIQSGDYLEYSEDKRYGFDRPIYHLREPGAVFLWQACAWGSRWIATGDWFGPALLSAPERQRGFDLLGALSGGVFLALLAAFVADASPRLGARTPLAAVAVLASALTWTFAGHIEFYAPLYAGLLFYYWRAGRYFRHPSNRNFAWMIASAGVAVTMHRAALFQLPALALVWLDPKRPFRPSSPTREQALTLLAAIILLCLLHFIPIFSYVAFDAPILVFEDYNWLPELITPLTQGWADYVAAHSRLGSYHLFTFGSRAHWEHFLFFVAVASPLGLPLVILYRRSIRDRWTRFLLLSAAAGWLWAFVWHPHLGYGDWDLFANPGLPTNLLAATLLLRAPSADLDASQP